ncbi:uncharacterized protein LOC126329981 isoform X2 [Schistocerca gregaria]|uniref:uncharacterized protein LOC126329981 isoform X2 n=1 Tax=Schistocerca gregaria TaxID=7010 RepID=UPI00211EFE03|nr:uncharacterized protein LOC126329981 isoform X2 [Schistocerca gregaria]
MRTPKNPRSSEKQRLYSWVSKLLRSAFQFHKADKPNVSEKTNSLDAQGDAESIKPLADLSSANSSDALGVGGLSAPDPKNPIPGEGGVEKDGESIGNEILVSETDGNKEEPKSQGSGVSTFKKYKDRVSEEMGDDEDWLKLKQSASSQVHSILQDEESEEKSQESESEQSACLDNLDQDDLVAAAAEFVSSSEEEGDEGEESEVHEFGKLEAKSKKLDERRRRMREEAQTEFQEQLDDQQSDDSICEQKFEFPSKSALKKEKELMVDLSYVKERIRQVLHILSNFKQNRDPLHSHKEYQALLRNDLGYYYGYNDFLLRKLSTIFSSMEMVEYMETSEADRPLTIRTNTLKTRRSDLMKALAAKGIKAEPIKWNKDLLQIFESSVPITSLTEYMAGHYILQSASSITAVSSLDPQPDERILDMCAAPGAKTTHIAQLMKNTGMIVANDINPQRMNSLVANLHRLGVCNTIVTNYDGGKFPKIMKGFDRVLLDAPCTGTGIISRDTSIKTSKSKKDLNVLVLTQKRLLLAAIDSVDPHSRSGGIIVYSTCSVLAEENEFVINYALKKRFVKVVDSGMEFGKPGIVSHRGIRLHDTITRARRYYPQTYNMDGFFVCRLRKLKNGPRDSAETAKNENLKKKRNRMETTKRQKDEFLVLDEEEQQRNPKKTKAQ